MKKTLVTSALFALLLGVASAAPSTSATKGSTTSLVPGNHHHHHHGCVPEPSSLLALGMGAVLLVRRRGKA